MCGASPFDSKSTTSWILVMCFFVFGVVLCCDVDGDVVFDDRCWARIVQKVVGGPDA